jgi:nickel superoxide dismutase
LIDKLSAFLNGRFPAPEVEAHCDGPCGVYDPAAARIAAEAVLSMTKKMSALTHPAGGDPQAHLAYHNTVSRFIAIKEEQAQLAKKELLVLWTDYFKPDHLKDVPNLHEMFWKAAKLCSDCKQQVSEAKATELLKAIEEIHRVFWMTKKREVPWYTAS